MLIASTTTVTGISKMNCHRAATPFDFWRELHRAMSAEHRAVGSEALLIPIRIQRTLCGDPIDQRR